jgi:hypothetical protein
MVPVTKRRDEKTTDDIDKCFPVYKHIEFLRVNVLAAAIEPAFHPRTILEKRLAHLSITSLKWYVLLHPDRRIMYETLFMAIAAILTVTVMTTLMEKQSYGFDLVSHPGGHIDENANGGSSDGGDANGGSACNFKCSASSHQ